ncbi:unnamed protein product [Pieris macdunnoughi]|uniref:Uncharacterized protein n=1 Tax=Pieris macdunnoughi TaxID=345717 RepID=A0A821SDH9_9NEOP|nr:unnamed protein product [Pieris macdunnoughi]
MEVIELYIYAKTNLILLRFFTGTEPMESLSGFHMFDNISRSAYCWSDRVKENLLQLKASNWRELAKERERWKILISEAKKLFGLPSQRTTLQLTGSANKVRKRCRYQLMQLSNYERERGGKTYANMTSHGLPCLLNLDSYG